jgi:hemoglobin-like flavoprotein
VSESYGRCCLQKEFFEDFYAIFLESSPEVKFKFAKTNFDRQFKLLRDGITFMIMFARGDRFAATKMEKLGELHNSKHLNIGTRLYSLWLNCLIRTIQKHDRELTPELRALWEDAMNVGIKYLISKHTEAPVPSPLKK